MHESIGHDGTMGEAEMQLFHVMSKHTTLIIFALISTVLATLFLLFAQTTNDYTLFFGIDLTIKCFDIAINTLCLIMQLAFADPLFNYFCHCFNHCWTNYYIHSAKHSLKLNQLYKQAHKQKQAIAIQDVRVGSISPRNESNDNIVS